jgi:hypothetical protein
MVLPPVSGVTSFQIYCFLYTDLSPGLRAGASLRKAAAAKPYGARCSSGSLGPQGPNPGESPNDLDLDPIYGIFPGIICGCHYGIKMEYFMASSIIILYSMYLW